jgi:hypothetical protein
MEMTRRAFAGLLGLMVWPWAKREPENTGEVFRIEGAFWDDGSIADSTYVFWRNASMADARQGQSWDWDGLTEAVRSVNRGA